MRKPNAQTDTNIITIKDYPSGMVAYDVSNIQSRSFTVGDIRYLMSKGLDHESVVEKYNEACINFEVFKLSLLDYFFHATNVTLFSNPQQQWIWSPRCTKCKRPMSITIMYSNFFEFNEVNLDGYPLWVTINGKELEIGFFTVRNWLDIKDVKYVEYDKELLTIALMVKNMEVEEAYQFIKNIVNLEDLQLLSHCEKLLGSHGLKPKELKCEYTECGHTDTYDTELAVSDVTPFRQPPEIIKSRIVFGKRN